MEGVTRTQEHQGHEECADGALLRDMDTMGTRAARQSTSRARPERVYDVSSPQTFNSCAAKRVTPGVLRVLVNMARLDEPNAAEDRLWLRDKFAVANLGQKQSLRVAVLA